MCIIYKKKMITKREKLWKPEIKSEWSMRLNSDLSDFPVCMIYKSRILYRNGLFLQCVERFYLYLFSFFYEGFRLGDIELFCLPQIQSFLKFPLGHFNCTVLFIYIYTYIYLLF